MGVGWPVILVLGSFDPIELTVPTMVLMEEDLPMATMHSFIADPRWVDHFAVSAVPQLIVVHLAALDPLNHRLVHVELECIRVATPHANSRMVNPASALFAAFSRPIK
jgi:hypothetical protein